MPRGRATDVSKTGQYGKFRESRLGDPYISKKGWPEPTICPICNTVYYKKHWLMSEALLFEIKKMKDVKYHKCPACRKIEDHYAMGILNLTGDFVKEHRDEIINLLRSEERHAMEKNPLERIITISKKNGGLYVETTTDSLALRIGRVLTRAYKGTEEFKWKYGDKSVIIEWGREK